MPRISLALRLVCAATLASTTTGCVELLTNALKKTVEDRRVGRVHDRIETACAAKDTDDLKKILGFESNKENFARASRCYTDIKAEALLATSCDEFNEAFEWIETKEGKTKKSTRSPLVDFKIESYKDKKTEKTRAREFADKAVQCKTTRFLFGYEHKTIGTADIDWVELLGELDQDALYAMLRDDLREKKGIVESGGDVRTTLDWLIKSQPASRCADLEGVTHSQPTHRWRGAMLPFFTQKKCVTETRAVAGELLASSVAEYRMDACLALRDANDKTHLGKMKRLAETDPARSIEKERAGYWVYAFVTHPVRETCMQAVNQLELKGS